MSEGFEPPAAAVFDEPKICVELNVLWVSHVIGLVGMMTMPDYWKADEATQYDLTQQANELLNALVNGNCP